VGNCNGFFDPARAVLQRHETANSDEVRRIGPALVFERLREEDTERRTAIEQLVGLQATPSCPLLFCKDWPVQSFFADYMYASLAAGRAA
jgi:hypothetical protein